MNIEAPSPVNPTPLNETLYPAIPYNHDEFVDWLRTERDNSQIVDFLAQRQDTAGATPRQWAVLNRMVTKDDYLRLNDEQRRQVVVGILDQQAFDAFDSWLNANQSALA